MSMIENYLAELEQEGQTTRKILERVPDDKYDWQPHEKSMSIQRLASHIAELPTWIGMILHTDELDFAKNPYQPEVIRNTNELIKYFEKSLADGKKQLEKAHDSQLPEPWTLREGEKIYLTSTKGKEVRMTYCQIVHHRAQLGVYLRLLDVPLPGSYGPTADDPAF